MKKAIFAIVMVMAIMAIMPMIKASTGPQFTITSGPTFSKTSGYPGDSVSVTFTIKNIGDTQGTYYAEAGIATKGWAGYSMVSAPWWQDLFAFTAPARCCSGNEFYYGAVILLNPGESNTITLYPKVPTSSSYDHCNNQGSAWAGYGNNYWIGFNACNNCYGEAGHSCITIFSNNWQTFTINNPNPTATCGNNACESGETQSNCCKDCGCPNGQTCSNNQCTTTPANPTCGDGTCNGAETCSTCPSDCGACPTTTCSSLNCCKWKAYLTDAWNYSRLSTADCSLHAYHNWVLSGDSDYNKCPSSTGSTCPTGQICSDGSCIIYNNNETNPANPTSCVGEEEIFYTDGSLTQSKTNGAVLLFWWGSSSSGDVLTPSQLDTDFPGLSAKYYNSKSGTCCANLTYSYVDEKSYTTSNTIFTILFNQFGKATVKYSIYKCVTKAEASKGFCVEQAQTWLNKYTHADDCSTNTFWLVGIIIVGAILFYIVINAFKKQ